MERTHVRPLIGIQSQQNFKYKDESPHLNQIIYYQNAGNYSDFALLTLFPQTNPLTFPCGAVQQLIGAYGERSVLVDSIFLLKERLVPNNTYCPMKFSKHLSPLFYIIKWILEDRMETLF